MGLTGRMVFSARKAWFRIVARIVIRRTGIVKLSKDVGLCEYEDVKVMWQILHKHEQQREQHARFQKRSSRSNNWSSFRRRLVSKTGGHSTIRNTHHRRRVYTT